ncbi:MAG: hypothetical protein ACKO6Q_05790 [Bacteroidota bacterium]
MSCGREPLSSVRSTGLLISVDSLNQKLRQEWRERGSAGWSDWNDDELWSAIAYSDSLVAVGYQPRGFIPFPQWIADIDLNAME